MKTSLFSSDLQRKIKKALSRFWQERFISLEDEDSPTARDFLLENPFFLNSDHFVESEPFPKTNPALLNEALELAGFPEQILSQKLTSLSNGELRRLMFARNYMEEPDLWILDDPFGGLDPSYREFLAERIKLFQKKGIEMQINLKREEYPSANWEKFPSLRGVPEGRGVLLFALKKLCVAFGSKKIIENLDLEIYKGQHWAITGPNGSGKSTLLGILSGDHPQIYNNDLELLGQKVKNGFSISKHKAKIGFFSPEMALQISRRSTVLEILLENFPQPVLTEEKKAVLSLISDLDLNKELNTPLKNLNEEQLKLVLIARAISKNPQVLILDEVPQGLCKLLDKISEKTTLIFTTHYPDEMPKCVTNELRLFLNNH